MIAQESVAARMERTAGITGGARWGKNRGSAEFSAAERPCLERAPQKRTKTLRYVACKKTDDMQMIPSSQARRTADPGPRLLDIIRAEYREMPCLRLTKWQMQRLWSLDADTCDWVVRALEAQHFLKRAADRYVLAA